MTAQMDFCLGNSLLNIDDLGIKGCF